jgi:hypothetical protein
VTQSLGAVFSDVAHERKQTWIVASLLRSATRLQSMTQYLLLYYAFNIGVSDRITESDHQSDKHVAIHSSTDVIRPKPEEEVDTEYFQVFIYYFHFK